MVLCSDAHSIVLSASQIQRALPDATVLPQQGMARVIRYITHPQVVIDPNVDIQKWGLSQLGQSRVAALAASGVLDGTSVVFSSTETKALETAQPLADALGISVVRREGMHENDRSASGFLKPDLFEDTADQFFANPFESVRGWETAQNAQRRVVAEYETCLSSAPARGDILFVGHGAVGTLLFCHLAGLEISRAHDQGSGGGGCFFEIGSGKTRPNSGWQPIEAMVS